MQDMPIRLVLFGILLIMSSVDKPRTRHSGFFKIWMLSISSPMASIGVTSNPALIREELRYAKVIGAVGGAL